MSAAEPARQQIAVAVVEHDGRFLVGIRPPGAPLAGMSEFPGGKIRPGESPAQAAERESVEETGLAVVAHETYSVVEHVYPHGRLTLHFFRCTLADAANSEGPAAPFRWVGRKELAQLEFPEANRELIAALVQKAFR
jgi:8-oxo-dGTP diphosphatase